jgi:P27 family predicted phage terminase small subunit
MQSLGVYKKEFEPIIKIYSGLRTQYDELTERFEASGYEYSESTNQGSKKHPIVTTLESLRKDILAYASQLGLTPQGLKRIQEEDPFARAKKSSGLAAALQKLEDK